MPRRPLPDVRARAVGVLVFAGALAAAELAHAVVRPVPSLVQVVDQAVVRAVPGRLSHRAIEAVGTADKPLLRAGTLVLLAVLGLALGPVLARRRRVAYAVLLGPAAFAVACAAAVDGVAVGGAAVGAAAAVAGGGLSRAVLRPLVDGGGGPSPRGAARPGTGASRRRFLATSSAWAGGAALVVAGGPGLRRALVAPQWDGRGLPVPADPAGPVVPELGTTGISPVVTGNAAFYRIDEALVVPWVDVSSWRLTVTGLVDRPLSLSFEDLLAEPLIERWVTLACVSNEVGGRLVGNARWLGVRLGSLLARAGVRPGATQVIGRSVDGFTAGFPLEAALDGREAMVAVGMNGVPLPPAHGFPARLVVPGLFGMVSATKWLREIHLTTWDDEPYWAQRGWDRLAPVTVQSRVDTPRDYAVVPAGRLPVGGVAWAPTHGVAAVDVRVDRGPWQAAMLGQALDARAWRQWRHVLDLPPGRHEIEVRATTDDGLVQPAEKRSAFPGGATGLHTLHVRCE